MARKGDIEIPIAVDTGGVQKQIQNGLVEPIEDAEKALKKLGDTDAGKDLDKAMDRAQDATEDLSDELTDTRKELGKLGYAAKDVGGEADRGFGQAKEAAGEFKQEALANFSEVTSSFDGSMSSIQDLAQGTLGGLASTGLPGVGLAAGAAAVAVGLIGAAIEANSDAADLNAETIAEWADAYIEAGNKALGAGVLAAKFQDILTDPEKFKAAEKNAKNWGTTVETAIAAMSGNTGAIEDVSVALNQQREAAEKAAAAAQELAMENGSALVGTTAQEQAYLAGATALSALTGEMEAGANRAALLSAYNVDLINSTKGATKEVDELGNELYTLPDQTQILIDAETGLATQNVDRFKGDLDGIPDVVTSTVRVTADLVQAYRDLQRFQDKAAQGVRVPVGLGRTWE